MKSYATLKRKLDKVFSEWSRRRFADSNGNCRCVSCGAVKHWKEMQAGHFQKRHYLATRWEPENVAPQDSACNVFKGGNLAAYAAWGVNRYGPDWPARMVAQSKRVMKLGRGDLLAMIEEYQNKLAGMA